MHAAPLKGPALAAVVREDNCPRYLIRSSGGELPEAAGRVSGLSAAMADEGWCTLREGPWRAGQLPGELGEAGGLHSAAMAAPGGGLGRQGMRGQLWRWAGWEQRLLQRLRGALCVRLGAEEKASIRAAAAEEAAWEAADAEEAAELHLSVAMVRPPMHVSAVERGCTHLAAALHWGFC